MKTIEDWDEETCPAHGTPRARTYSFGNRQLPESEVVTFKGCACALRLAHDPAGCLPTVTTLHQSYASAAGASRLHTAIWRAKAAPFR